MGMQGKMGSDGMGAKHAFDLKDYEFLRYLQVFDKPISRIVSIGVALPERVVDNEEIAGMVEAPPFLKRHLATLIYRVTGNKTRRYAEPGTPPSELAVKAVNQALERAHLEIGSIDTLIFASTDMDTLEPATANIVQHKLGVPLLNSFDVTNACNSFLQAMNVANGLIASGGARRVLICSGEIGSYVCNRRVENMKDLDIKLGGLTLGDAGAAMILEPADGDSGLLEINLNSLGEYWELCHVPETTDWRQREGGIIHGWFYLKMSALAEVAREVTKKYFQEYRKFRQENFNEKDFFEHIDRVVPHQISRRFIEVIAKSISLKTMDRVVVTADIYGNTASTAIPLAMNLMMEQGLSVIGSGEEVLLYGAASGFGIGHLRVRM